VAYTLEQLVDLERYPLGRLDSAGAELVARCQQELEDHAVCHLPGFVRAEAVAAICAESARGKDSTYWVRNNRRAYSWRDPAKYAEGHTVGVGSPNHLGTITTDAFAADSAFVSLFQLPELTEFLRTILRQPELFPVACPYLAANIKVMGEGCKHAWHFDQNDGAVTFLFQNAAAGGQFEYVPYLRSDDDENYEAVESLLDGSESGVKRVALDPGSFCLFKGRRSLHRVTEVTRGAPDRLLAVFSYHSIAGHRYVESTVESVLGRLPDDFYETTAN
jgi:hypothetical protein